MEDKDHETPINRGEMFMRERRNRRKQPEEVEPNVEETQEGEKMNTSLVAVLTASIVLGGTILGFLVGWFSSAYYQSFLDNVLEYKENQEAQFQVTPHPEMLDSDGNMIPFTVSKLISVEFDPVDAFDSDPFDDD